MFNSKINYTGKVTLKLNKKRSFTNNNSGTHHLFDIINDMLTNTMTVGNLSSINKRLPNYISIISSNNVTSEQLEQGNFSKLKDKTLLLKNLPIVSRSINEDKNISFSSLLSHDIIMQPKDDHIDDVYVLLLDSTEENILAYSTIDYQTYVKPIIDNVLGSAEICWEMSFRNDKEQV